LVRDKVWNHQKPDGAARYPTRIFEGFCDVPIPPDHGAVTKAALTPATSAKASASASPSSSSGSAAMNFRPIDPVSSSRG